MWSNGLPWRDVLYAGGIVFILGHWVATGFPNFLTPSRTACALQGEVRTLTVTQVSGTAYRHELVRPVCFDKAVTTPEVLHD